MDRAEFHYDLPAELIAQQPLPERSASRLLVVDGDSMADRRFGDLSRLLRAGDLLVLNDTRVIRARLRGRKSTGGRVEMLLERITGTRTATAQIKASRSPRAGSELRLANGFSARVLGRRGSLFRLEFDSDISPLLEAHGEVPLPPYIRRGAAPEDRARYQTVYARDDGSVAAPTAGLHFDPALLEALHERGVESAFLTLHVGIGTFAPVRTRRIEDHRLHSEWCRIRSALCARIQQARQQGGRIVAVGTTTVRALESAAIDGELKPIEGDTSLFIHPGFRFRVVDALITNFHLPESSLLMLVCAFAGRDRMLAAYRHAVAQRYRFFSYGDAMLIKP
ncbi:MAG: tRNA preQ1(34) S-adenosylmethionine ribosyltransferase-isomerase QueA [Rhodospirillaceae bacterium]|nr:tRNA preQ1(34) S-adenosylmethionine ribosyltransferase-isomerase QueA [Rhodospirillaceae bacterium]MDD9999276.1 tRNA preQ1(34) S-adenosylmethionine ribosyltransferase-isomerase QueA [Rhodospirillaceae bacterium]MDE0362265.1 tRNA preQ1(34) S-adenosylmethionine ribosyltransferase-isomerase QueA [Rhodospirillaceae bacterium]